MTALESLLTQLEEAEARATLGPWVCENRAHLPWCTPAILTPNRGTLSEMTHYGNMEADCNLLVQCRNNIRKLIEIIRVLEKAIYEFKPHAGVPEECGLINVLVRVDKITKEGT